MSLETEQANPPDRPIPKTLFGFDVIDHIGDGAASAIYAVSAPDTKQVYALKHVIRNSDKDDRFIAQLQNEFDVASKVRHPGLRRAFDLKFNRTLFRKITDAALVMELVDGIPLHRQPLHPIPIVVKIFSDVASALSSLHYLGIVHCDLKPNNILTDHDGGGVKIIDFGQAARTGSSKHRVQGTPDFIAPEQVKLRPVTYRTDVYNFGATLYWALTGQRIPTLFTVAKSERHVVKQSKFPSPIELNPEVPEPLSQLVMDCIRMDPLQRPSGMTDLLDRLR